MFQIEIHWKNELVEAVEGTECDNPRKAIQHLVTLASDVGVKDLDAVIRNRQFSVVENYRRRKLWYKIVRQ